MKDILEKQKEFQELLGNDITSNEFRKQMVLGLFEEASEVMKTTPTKKKKHKMHENFDRDEFIKECVDVQLYLINLVISSEINWEYFESLVRQKQTINFNRQKDGY